MRGKEVQRGEALINNVKILYYILKTRGYIAHVNDPLFSPAAHSWIFLQMSKKEIIVFSKKREGLIFLLFFKGGGSNY